tara:strand:- start:679 stop:960 length:282 start_codon:yes stop_codon:yes gene_type:complete
VIEDIGPGAISEFPPAIDRAVIPPTFIDDGDGHEWRDALMFPNSALRVADLSPPSGLTLSPEPPGALPADAVVQTSKGAAASAGFSQFHDRKD